MRLRCAWTLTGATLTGEPVIVSLEGHGSWPRLRHLEVEGELHHRNAHRHLSGEVRVGRHTTYSLEGQGWSLTLTHPLTLRGGPPGFTCVDGTLEDEEGRHPLHLRLDPRGGVSAWLRSISFVRNGTEHR